MSKSGFRIIADKVAQSAGWDDFNDVIYNADNRRTIASIIEVTEEEIESIKSTAKDLLNSEIKKYLNE